jgi:hypothetical protein
MDREFLRKWLGVTLEVFMPRLLIVIAVCIALLGSLFWLIKS